MLMAMPAMAQGKTLEVSFDYQRQSGPGSNQYAVWIENEKGEVVKTLFVTSFSTKDKAGSVSLTSSLTEADEAHKNMITNVKAEIK